MNPNEYEMKNYFLHYSTLGNLIPCIQCRKSYLDKISGDNSLTADSLKNRNTLTKWLYDFHEKVNEKLDMQYYVTYEEVKKKYSSAESTNENNPINIFAERDCPILNTSVAEQYLETALEAVDNKNYLHDFSHIKNNINYYIRNKDHEYWKRRNKLCRKIMDEMIYKSIPAIDEDEEQLSKKECELLLMMSTTIGNKKIKSILSGII